MVMNHLVIYYVEIALHYYASAKHEGKYELLKKDQEHYLRSQNTMQCFPGEEATICPCCFFPSPRKVSYPMGHQLKAL